EAVELLCDHLFALTKSNRIRLVIHPANEASKRVADKSGFSYEGIARGAWYHEGRNHDVEVWSILRDDPRPSRAVEGDPAT
ncbi:MAG: GNAT family protein, partial [Pseudolysinimonas sp.]